jgi:hypothetical protein
MNTDAKIWDITQSNQIIYKNSNSGQLLNFYKSCKISLVFKYQLLQCMKSTCKDG